MTFFLRLMLLTISLHTALWGYRYELAVGMIFRDEAPYLKEWIEYHRLVGVEHFYLFNDQSRDGFRKVLAPYISEGIVELYDANQQPDFNGTQVDCYNRTLIKSYRRCKWVAMIDSDEFLVAANAGKTIPQLLKAYKNYGGVILSWKNFGTSSCKQVPKDKLMIECLTSCAAANYPMNTVIKSIVRPERVLSFKGPHWPDYVVGWCAVDTDAQRFIEGMPTKSKKNVMWINHYWTRDEHFFYKQKIPRSIPWGRTAEWMEGVATALNQSSDFTILRHVPKLRSRLFGKTK